MFWSPRNIAKLIIVWGLLATPALAHQGPPYPIVMDKRVGPYTLSVWTDPDVGIGTFYVIFDSSIELPENTRVEICVQPVSGRLEEVCHPASRQDLRNRVQFYGEVPFDQQEMWRIRVRVDGPAGSGEVITEVEVTPPGFGYWDLLIYGFPFLLFGGLWALAALRRHTRFVRTTTALADAKALSRPMKAPMDEPPVQTGIGRTQSASHSNRLNDDSSSTSP